VRLSPDSAWFPAPELTTTTGRGTRRLETADATRALGALGVLGDDVAALLGRGRARDVEIVAVHTEIASLDDPALDAYDTYLRLQLLSAGLVRSPGTSYDAVGTRAALDLLPTVAWTNHGPCAVAGFETTRIRLRGRAGPVTVHAVDRLPPHPAGAVGTSEPAVAPAGSSPRRPRRRGRPTTASGEENSRGRGPATLRAPRPPPTTTSPAHPVSPPAPRRC